MRVLTHPTLLILAGICAAGLASTSHGASELKSARYVCQDGERFSVEYKRTHARLRNGSGVFALSADGGGNARRYSDGDLTLVPRDGGATLQRSGQSTASDCLSDSRQS